MSIKVLIGNRTNFPGIDCIHAACLSSLNHQQNHRPLHESTSPQPQGTSIFKIVIFFFLNKCFIQPLFSTFSQLSKVAASKAKWPIFPSPEPHLSALAGMCSPWGVCCLKAFLLLLEHAWNTFAGKHLRIRSILKHLTALPY